MHLSHMQQSYPAHVQNVGNEKFLPFPTRFRISSAPDALWQVE